jgi:lia operon protein LiaF
VKYSNVFGDLNITCENIDMRNVEVSGFLGDIEVMLRQAKLGPGLSRMVISGFIGDVRVMVPTGMAVFASGSNFIGDLNLFGRQSTGFGNSLDGQTQNYATSEQKLYVAINTFIGDVRVIEV